MTELRFEKIEEYLFAPFNTFVYVDEDRLRFEGSYEVRKKLVDELNLLTIPLGRDNLYLEWCLEDSEDFKLSKGVFSPPGTENSFVMARVVNKESVVSPVTINGPTIDFLPSNPLQY